MDLIISDEVVEIQERKIIFEDEKEVFTIVKRGLDLVTETQVKEKNEHVEILFKNQIEFFSTIQKEPCLPRLFPNYFDWDTKLNNLCYFEEVASTFLEYLEQIKQQKKLLPFKELIGYFKTLLDGFCFLQLMGYETHKITIKSLFFTKEKEIKLMSFYAKHLNGKSALNCEKENALAFSILFLNILNLKLEFDRDKISLEEINDIEEKYKNNLNQNEKELMKKILKFLSNVANEKKEISLISLFIKTIQKINTTTLKKIILLEDGIIYN